jgi:hypothetical protein
MEIKIGKDVRLAVPRGRADVLQLKLPVVNDKSILRLAAQLGMESKTGTLATSPDRIAYTAGFMELTVFRASGGFRYLDRSRWQVDDGESNVRMTDADAGKRASALAAKMKLAPAKEFRFAKAARLHVAAADLKAKQSYDRVIDVGVALQRMIGKVPVDGPGGRVVVYLDARGDVTGIEKIWRERAKVFRKGAAFRSLDELIAEMSTHYRTKDGVIEVQEIRTAYFEEGWRSQQKYLQPAYIVRGIAMSPNERLRKKVVYVAPALSNTPGRITPPLSAKKPLAARRG